MQPEHQPIVRQKAAFQQGAARLIKQAPALASALAAGGLLGLLAVCTIQPLLAPGVVAIPAIMKLLEALGLNVGASYLGEALKQVWQRSGKPAAAEATRGELAKALTLIVSERADAAAEIARIAQDSGALQQTLLAINSGVDGSAELLAGLVYDSRRHGAALASMQTELRRGLGALYLLALGIQGDTATIREQTSELLRLARAGSAGLAELDRRLAAESNQRRQNEQIALHDYLSTLGEDCNRLSLADADTSDPNKAGIGMDSVYIRLEIARTVEQPNQKQRIAQERRHLTAIAALAQQPRLVLLGTPGSGKSTFVNFLARCLSLAHLDDRQRWLERLGAEWPQGALVPVYILLRDFTAWLAAQAPRIDHGDARLPWHFLAERHGPALADYLHRLAHEGRALLLLDGLDEVGAGADGWPLVAVRESIVALAGGLGTGSRALVTCRVLDYQQAQRQLIDWPSDVIEPLSQELRAEFIHKWYAELERLRRPLDASAAVLEQRLTEAVRDGTELRRLAGNPLLLTMMALVHSYKGRLPENRVKLYEECIEFLLHRWRRRPDDQPLRERLSLDQGQWTEKNLLELLYLLGHIAHQHGVNPDGESGADLPYQQVIEAAQRYFTTRFGVKKSAARAEEFAEFIGQASNGILQIYSYVHSRDLIYRFPHRTFQEYLAGHALINSDLLLGAETPDDERDLITRALQYVDTGAQWREALLLAAGRLVLNGSSRQVVELARELLPHEPTVSGLQARRVMLAGELLAEIGSKLVASMGRRLAPTWDETRDHLLALLPHPPDRPLPPLTPPERNRAALILAQLGDPRPGVCTLQPDWCDPFPARDYAIAEGTATVRLAEFRIARYPVTVWQFRQFWEAKGYQNEHWLPKSGLAWLQQEPVTTQPYLWDAPDWMAHNQPVVGISWYEAVAFCNWLTEQGKQAGWLAAGEVIRLPSEAEWEVAAMWDERADTMRQWQPPEGEFWQNVDEAGIGRTTPVGLFPQGASPAGALDMAGNIWEWCGSAYDDYPKQADKLRDDFPADRYGAALRGGAYYLQNIRSSWGARDWGDPDFQDIGRGCRVCVCSRSTV